MTIKIKKQKNNYSFPLMKLFNGFSNEYEEANLEKLNQTMECDNLM